MRLLLVALLVAGCGKVKGDGDVDAPVIDSCEPNAFVQCSGNVAQVCNATGDGTIDTDCGAPGCNAGASRCNECIASTDSCGASSVDHCGADGLPAGSDACVAGCTEAPAPHCTYIQPNYAALADACDMPAAMPTLTIDTTQTLDSGSDLVCTGGILTQTGGPPICVLRFGTITVNANRTLKFIGARAVALIADAGITVDGTIDVSADGRTNGPGGGLRTSGDRSNSAIGGGGAGFRNAGGSGGSDAATGGGGTGGAASTNPADLIALIGGARPQTSLGGLEADPGGGGGALTLIACRGTVTVSTTGVIDAGGGGGQGGFDQIQGAQISVTSAAGGGSGGYVVLQGLGVTVTGSVFANGGAGGGGTSSNEPAVGATGQDGLRSTTAANGGAPSANGGAGGQGGVGATVAGDGRMPATAAGTPGGGGASAGFFQSYTPSGVTPTLTPAAASPGFSANRTLMTR